MPLGLCLFIPVVVSNGFPVLAALALKSQLHLVVNYRVPYESVPYYHIATQCFIVCLQGFDIIGNNFKTLPVVIPGPMAYIG